MNIRKSLENLWTAALIVNFAMGMGLILILIVQGGWGGITLVVGSIVITNALHGITQMVKKRLEANNNGNG